MTARPRGHGRLDQVDDASGALGVRPERVVLRPAVLADREGVNHELTPPLQQRWTDDAGCSADALDHPVDQLRRPDRERSSRQHLLCGERPPVDRTHERVLGHRHATRTQHVERGKEHCIAVGHALVGEPLQHDTLTIGTYGEPRATRLAPGGTALQPEAEVAHLLRVHVLGGSSNTTFTCSKPNAPSSAAACPRRGPSIPSSSECLRCRRRCRPGREPRLARPGYRSSDSNP